MKNTLLAALMVVTTASSVALPVEAQRRDRPDYQWHGDDDNWDASRDYRRSNARERRLSREDRIYRGRDGRSYCRRNDGTTGLVVGGVGGAVVGNLIGGGLLGTLAGGAGGALLGRSIDKGKVRCR
ncbi:glycine zipper 2TM domain-containing protein [Sphingomonas sp. KR1UV-12]|uniref:17 kDa surface antigen n=1 Tax=Sphingomonas aurea TaxID=3063994 RepID=A0ABT9EJ12_9SPHN|nr:glycine zipper 2TM domain-containing protein [Sphingomonas sp. KR1UV-12]MDP1026914.1 glycine zipper 2TM domain-containing protein [Sphingomonas sp. KR1UV-12]